MSEPIRLRPSKLDRLMACVESASITPHDGVLVNPTNPQARLGSATHALMTIDDPWFEVEGVAAAFDVDVDELKYLLGCALRMRDRIGASVPEGGIHEHRMRATLADGIDLGGTADYVHVVDRTGFVLDLKTGRSYVPTVHQLMAYAWLLTRDGLGADLDAVWCGTWWPQLDVFEGRKLLRRDLELWAELVVDRIRQGQGTFAPSAAACRYCDRRYDCDARDAWLRSASACVRSDDLVGQAVTIEGEDVHADADLVQQTFETLKAVQSAAGDGVDALRHVADMAPDRQIVLGDGSALKAVDVERTKVTNPKAVLAELRAMGVDDDALWDAVGLSVGTIRKLAMATATKGQKTEVANALVDRLSAAGHLKTSTSTKLERGAPAAGVSNV